MIFFIQNFAFEKENSSNHKDYKIINLCLQITRHTAMGQQLDLMSASCKLENFDMKRYSQIVQYKTCYYSFYLPVQLGMILADVKDAELYRQSRAILLDMGHLFQIQDDYLDCFGNPEVTGKIGTDIQDRKCSWLIVQAMEKANPHQKKILNVSVFFFHFEHFINFSFHELRF